MPLPRKALVSLDATPYYHCVSRCVRRAFLCGADKESGSNFDHRRRWIEERMLTLTNIFALDIAAYAIMSNHYHIVLHIDRDKALNWSDLEVIQQWHGLFSGTAFSKAVLDGGSVGRRRANGARPRCRNLARTTDECQLVHALPK